MEVQVKGALKANEDELNNLHQLVAKALIQKIKDGDASPQDMAQAIKFLKDNEIVADITTSPVLPQLVNAVEVGALPFDTGDDDADEETD